MNDVEKKRLALFLFGCIGTRLMCVYVAKTRNELLPYMGIVAILIATGLLYFYFSGTRTTGPEVFGGEIWWNHLRPIHATFYLIFAVFAIQKKKYSFWILMVDVMVGLIAELWKRVV
jgi:hypothetical protein